MSKIVFIPEVIVDDYQPEYWNEWDFTGVVLNKWEDTIPENAQWLAGDYYYDHTASIAKARDVWGLTDENQIKDEVYKDFQRIRDYLNGYWHFVIVGVSAYETLENGMLGEKVGYDCIGGVESDCGELINEYKLSLIDGLSRTLGIYGYETDE